MVVIIISIATYYLYVVNGNKFVLLKKKIITRGYNKEKYLIRWTIVPLTCKWFSVKVHKILLSDYQCLHDHPWAFITFLIKGGYVEYSDKGSKLYSRFSLLFRKASYQHRLEIHQPVWSIVITFKKVREWGFITPKGWVKWFNYTPSNNCE
ncbi:MAG: hypothetical protein V4663_06085 [Bacteroidota bacterium]